MNYFVIAEPHETWLSLLRLSDIASTEAANHLLTDPSEKLFVSLNWSKLDLMRELMKEVGT